MALALEVQAHPADRDGSLGWLTAAPRNTERGDPAAQPTVNLSTNRSGIPAPPARCPPSCSCPFFACLDANHLQRPTRTSAAQDGPRRHEPRTGRHGTAPDDTGRHGIAGLITQRSPVQIQPAQRSEIAGRRLRGRLLGPSGRPLFLPNFCPSGWRRRPSFRARA
jgi:hypothetical protein